MSARATQTGIVAQLQGKLVDERNYHDQLKKKHPNTSTQNLITKFQNFLPPMQSKTRIKDENNNSNNCKFE